EAPAENTREHDWVPGAEGPAAGTEGEEKTPGPQTGSGGPGRPNGEGRPARRSPRRAGLRAHQSLPSTSPASGVQAAYQVLLLTDGLTSRTLPSPMPTCRPAEDSPCGTWYRGLSLFRSTA